MATRARARIVDDPDCERVLLGFLEQHPRSDADALCGAFPWSRQALTDLLNRLAREWRICWRLERQPKRNGRRSARRVYWLAPPEFASSADQTAAAARVALALRPGCAAAAPYLHTGTPPDRAGNIQRMAIAGPFIPTDGRLA